MVIGAVCAMATDMTTIWYQIKGDNNFMVAEVPKEKAARNGFEEMTVALNSAPTSQQITEVKRLAGTIDSRQKIASVSQNGVDVSVYAAPASADGSLCKMMLVVDKNDNAEKVLVVLYGICTQEGLTRAVQNLSLEDIIGG